VDVAARDGTPRVRDELLVRFDAHSLVPRPRVRTTIAACDGAAKPADPLRVRRRGACVIPGILPGLEAVMAWRLRRAGRLQPEAGARSVAAGPLRIAPKASKRDPWQGQSQEFS